MFSFFRSDVSRDSLIVSSFWLSLTMRESLETSDLKKTEHRPPFLSLPLTKTVSSCVVQIVCVITNQGSSNPNCLNITRMTGVFFALLLLFFKLCL